MDAKTQDIIARLESRIDYTYLMVDGTYNYPKGMDGQIINLAHDLIQNLKERADED